MAKLTKSQPSPKINFHMSSREDFIELTQEYLEDILYGQLINENDYTIVTHNMLEPFAPEQGFVFFKDIKSIVIDRDVRDIFVTGSVYSEGFNDIVPLYSRIVGSFDMDIFIKRQRIMREKIISMNSNNVLRLQFEDLILNYENTVNKICDFLNISTNDHIHPKKYFDPNKSSKNVKLWQKAPDSLKPHLDKIYSELPQYCLA